MWKFSISCGGLYRRGSSVMCQCRHVNTATQTNLQTDQSDNVTQRTPHIPVLLPEVINILAPKNGGSYLDMTFGAGGHSRAILDAADCKVYALDRDQQAHGIAEQLATENPRLIPLRGCFSEVNQLLANIGFAPESLDGILIDSGASSMQFDSPSRGFMLSKPGPLDMRMDHNSKLTAADVVNSLPESDLANILKKYGEEKKNNTIARAIVDHRNSFGPITSTTELAELVMLVYEDNHNKDRLGRHSHAATRTFMALRIFVNDELNELYNGLNIAHSLLKEGSCCVAIAFHSLEDRIIKRCFHGIDMDAPGNMRIIDHARNSRKLPNKQDLDELMRKKWEPIDRKIVEATVREVSSNPRARSAKLRAAIKRTV